ncbi:CLUMA_CG019128, isoform A [Clunio marinus]|uniref:CLUMA_CG019128, isoform A n=1 Tax=Clunio marinus TaxID=568069 RepID=A0A1J1J094_9DIPT|nr:CLUMA_CG019128, isoform A [Clunio marinus]
MAFPGNFLSDIFDNEFLSVLKISYPNGVNVEGIELTPTQVRDEPNVEWEGNENEFYTLLMTDPDAPEPFREVRHWLVVNIPGSNLKLGDTKIQYVGSGPPKGSGTHRYIFLLFKQLDGKQEFKLPFVSNRSRNGRLSTCTRQLISDYNLMLISSSFYIAQYDDYVPVLHAQMGGPPPTIKWAYIGSGAPKDTGLHRYTFLVFKQKNGKQEFDLPTVPNTSREGRLSSNTRKLIADYNLQLIGGTFYLAQFDDYVPILHAQLGGAPPKN